MGFPQREPRSKTRHHMEVDTRLTLAEGDLDDLELSWENRLTKMEKKQDRIIRLLVGSIITFATSAAMLALNILVVVFG